FIVFLLFYFSRPHLHLLSFPTRRSSDLVPEREDLVHLLLVLGDDDHALRVVPDVGELPGDRVLVDGDRDAAERLRGELGPVQARSEEHTSELQSRFDLVCRLLLEKKKKK